MAEHANFLRQGALFIFYNIIRAQDTGLKWSRLFLTFYSHPCFAGFCIRHDFFIYAFYFPQITESAKILVCLGNIIYSNRR